MILDLIVYVLILNTVGNYRLNNTKYISPQKYGEIIQVLYAHSMEMECLMHTIVYCRQYVDSYDQQSSHLVALYYNNKFPSIKYM